MTSEEIDLTAYLEDAGLEVVETDLGEYIVQIAKDHPSHIVTPIIHKSKLDVARLFADVLGIDYTEDPRELTLAARKVLREKFRRCDMGICGVNFAVAETGTVVLVTNEGNGRLCTSRPKVVVALMGIEKVIPTMRDLAVFLKLLAKSATGQRLTVYTSLITGPRRPDDLDGPDEFHLVILDGNRTNILASQFRETLRCIRCGACLNTCPVYRNIGGHAYKSVYPGPIGKLISPLLNSYDQYQELPQSSSLCGACLDACPVMIDIPAMLIEMRNDLRRKGYLPWSHRVAFRAWSVAMRSPWLYRVGAAMYRRFVDAGSRDGWNPKLPGPLAGWTDHRDVPAMAERSFREQWKTLEDA
jgi:L-lactate dehydrogenase complex protein LldF